MHRPLRPIEQRLRAPHLIYVVDPETRVLEELRGLGVDLERLGLVQPVKVEQLSHTTSL